MGKKINILYIRTQDHLRLQGIHYASAMKDKCVLFTHGMSGNFIENYFTHILGETLSAQNIDFVYSHNRGYNHINDVTKKESDGSHTTIRIGATYERFRECIYDIDAWLKKIRKLGYKKIILMGHSLGCNKTIYYFSRKYPCDIAGIILASPPDMVGLFEEPKYNPHHKTLLKEARKNVAEGNPRRLVPEMVWDWYSLSSQTYVDLSETNGPVDNLPVRENKEVFSQLAKIDVPILGIMGENDDIVIRSIKDDLNLIASRAVNCPSFTKKIIRGADHNYNGKEKTLAKIVLEWVKKLS